VARWAGELARQYPENLAAAWAAGEVTGEWDRARELLGELVAEDPLNPHSQLALWSATKEDDPEGAIPAAMAAVSLAGPDADRDAYLAVAEFLAEADPQAGLEAFASRLDATGGIGGPLGRGYVRLVGATGDWDRLSEAADPILASSDDALAEDAACMLSRAGRHAEATELMEHAIRIKPSAAQANHWAPAPRVFADAGQMPRLVKLYDQVTSQHPDDASIALAAACAMLGAGDRDRARHWLERAEAILPGNAWIARQWAIWYEREGLLDDARRAWEQAQTRGLSGVAEGLERIEVLGEATAPVQTAMGVYVGYDLEQWPAPYRAAGTAATEAGKAGRPWMAVAAVLRTLADQGPERMVQGARRVAEDYPGNLAAMVGLAVIATGIETEGLDSPASAARAALDAIDDVEPGLVPCVYVVCGESLLHEGGREEAADAFRKAVEAPGITPGWEARAEAGLQAASETGREPEEEG
jgi:tetratricopeptide (TPR) repeat protein